MAGGGWSYEAKPKIKPKFENTKPKGVEAGAEIHFNWQP
jgi:hypothetical protein